MPGDLPGRILWLGIVPRRVGILLSFNHDRQVARSSLPGAFESAAVFGEFGVRGFKFHPSVQGFDPSDRQYYPLYLALAETGLPVVFHTGQTGIGAGTRGGFGIKLGYSNPILLDAVAADFPELTIIMAHPSVPWQDEAIAVATHKANVFIDLSGWSPKYFPPQLVRQANSLLQDKVLFGSDFPLITPERWLADFDKLDLKDQVRPEDPQGQRNPCLGLK